MPSLQASLPPELADSVIRLHRERLKAKYIGQQNYNTELLLDMVRQQFKRNMNETEPKQIHKLKDGAARVLINHMLYGSQKMIPPKSSSSR